MVAYDTGLSNNDAYTLVDAEIFANSGTHVDINTRGRMCQLRNDARDNGNMHLVEFIREFGIRLSNDKPRRGVRP